MRNLINIRYAYILPWILDFMHLDIQTCNLLEYLKLGGSYYTFESFLSTCTRISISLYSHWSNNSILLPYYQSSSELLPNNNFITYRILSQQWNSKLLKIQIYLYSIFFVTNLCA
jgi:hypothetical protein